MRKFLREAFDFKCEAVQEEQRPGILAIVKGTLGDHKTHNRSYEDGVIAKAIAQESFQEKLNNRAVFGTADHPEGNAGTKIQDISHLITDIKVEGKKVLGEFEVLDTPTGRILHTLLKAKTGIGWSLRGWGDSKTENKEEKVYNYEIETVDIVADPAVTATMTEREITLLAEEVSRSTSPLAEELSKQFTKQDDKSTENINELFILLEERGKELDLATKELAATIEDRDKLKKALTRLGKEVEELKTAKQTEESEENMLNKLKEAVAARSFKTLAENKGFSKEVGKYVINVSAVKALESGGFSIATTVMYENRLQEADVSKCESLEGIADMVEKVMVFVDAQEEILISESTKLAEAEKAKKHLEAKTKRKNIIARINQLKEAVKDLIERQKTDEGKKEGVKPVIEEGKEEPVINKEQVEEKKLDTLKIEALKERHYSEELKTAILEAKTEEDLAKVLENHKRSLLTKDPVTDGDEKPVVTERFSAGLAGRLWKSKRSTSANDKKA